MALTVEKASQSTNGKNVLVVATSTPGTTIHTAVAGTSQFDRVWLYAHNTDATFATLTIEFGETSNPVKVSIPPGDGYRLVIPGLLLQNGLTIGAFATVTNKITINAVIQRGP